jgi:hypothetical protein
VFKKILILVLLFFKHILIEISITHFQEGWLDSADLPLTLTNVRELIIRRDSSVKVPESLAKCEYGGSRTVDFFKRILPNLDILDIGGLAMTSADLGTLPLNLEVMGTLHNLCAGVLRCTAEVVHRGCHFSKMRPFPFTGSSNTMNNLREIYIDPFGVAFYSYSLRIRLQQEVRFADASNRHGGEDWVLLREYPNLERATLKRAEYDSLNDDWKVLPQEALIMFVRHTPKLRWFCSDLTEENIAILKEERPEVEFCN